MENKKKIIDNDETGDGNYPVLEEEKKTCSIFISYQWKMQPKVRQIHNELASIESLEVFMDIFKIRAGMNLYLTLSSSIQSADVVLACVSREYVKSKNCEREIIYADAFNKQIIPLYMEKIPMNELGSIGFILVRERYVNLYKNASLFENLSESDEFKDILDGIHQYALKLKGISIDMFKKKAVETTSNQDQVDSEVFRFRNDQPFGQDSLIESKVKLPVDNETSSNPVSMKSKISENKLKSPVKLIAAVNNFRLSKPNSNTETQNKPTKQKEVQPPKTIHNPLEIHPVIKELRFLYEPKVCLYPVGDRFIISNTPEKRGGMVYMRPVGWIRYGLKIKICYPDLKTWLTSDGSPNEWAVAYQGFKISPIRSLATRLIDKTGKLNPNLPISKQTKYAKHEDINPRSLRHGEECNLGVICSPNPSEAEKYTPEFIVDNKKYKMLLQCRVNPRRVRIPRNTKDLFVINNPVNIRPYGILIKELQ